MSVCEIEVSSCTGPLLKSSVPLHLQSSDSKEVKRVVVDSSSEEQQPLPSKEVAVIGEEKKSPPSTTTTTTTTTTTIITVEDIENRIRLRFKCDIFTPHKKTRTSKWCHDGKWLQPMTKDGMLILEHLVCTLLPLEKHQKVGYVVTVFRSLPVPVPRKIAASDRILDYTIGIFTSGDDALIVRFLNFIQFDICCLPDYLFVLDVLSRGWRHIPFHWMVYTIESMLSGVRAYDYMDVEFGLAVAFDNAKPLGVEELKSFDKLRQLLGDALLKEASKYDVYNQNDSSDDDDEEDYDYEDDHDE